MLPTNRTLRTPRYVLPDIETGYQLDPAQGFLAAILPLGVDKTNIVINPSLEIGTTGYNTITAGSIARDATVQKFGSYSLKCTPGASAFDGCWYNGVSLIAGTTYFGSVWFKGPAGRSYKFGFWNTGFTAVGQISSFVATGFWQRVSWVYTATASATHYAYFQKNNQSNITPFWIDGLQVEQDQLTTYIDGDQRGFVRGRQDYYWTGTPQASTSVRIGQSRAGGELVSFDRFGFRLLSIIGLGLGGLVTQLTPLARGGAYYQGTVIADRQFTVVGQIDGGGLDDLQQKRQALIDLFKPDVVSPDQPVVLRWQPTDDCANPIANEQDIVCVYEDGLSGRLDNLNSERLGLAFHIYLPFVTQEVGNAGSSLGYQTSVANANQILQRSPSGVWSAMGSGAAGGGKMFALLRGLDGKIYAGGGFTSMNAVANTANIAVWDPATGLWSALGTGAAGATNGVTALAQAPDGSIIAAGDFTSMGGVANTKWIAKWNGTAWVSISSGATGTLVDALAYDNTGVLYAAGLYSNLGGVAAANIAKMSTGGVWSAIGTGLTGGTTPFGAALARAPNGDMYVGGRFDSANGVSVFGIAKISGATFVALGSGGAGTGQQVATMAFMPDASLIVGGDFTTMGGITAARIAKWNGVSWTALSTGVDSQVMGLQPLPNGPLLVVGSFITAGGLALPANGIAGWNGSAWFFVDVGVPGTASGESLALAPDGTLYFGYTTTGTASAAALTTITNTGSAVTGPRISFTGPGTLYQLKNLTTGKAIYFNLTLLAGETAVLDLSDPSNITFVSTFRGNILSAIIPGSQLSDFVLASGANSISLFIAGTTTAATAAGMTWRITSHSIDAAVPGRLLP